MEIAVKRDTAKIKFCGLSRPREIKAANALKPDFIGFVFVPESRRFVPPALAQQLRHALSPRIPAVGVFADEKPETIAALLECGIIDLAQLHGHETDLFVRRLQARTKKPVIQAFCIRNESDIQKARRSSADYILLDSGSGTGAAFDWSLIGEIRRPWFLAGGLNPVNVRTAIRTLSPFAVDSSSGIETNGKKDIKKMALFTDAVRKEYVYEQDFSCISK